MMKRWFNGCILLLFSASSYALSTDRYAPFHIKADSSEILYQARQTKLTGNVLIIQGSTELTANTIVVYYNKINQLVKLIAQGNSVKPAVYKTLLDKKNTPFTASANKIEYFNQERKAQLIGAAKANDGSNSFAGEQLTYWVDTNEVVTKGNKQQKVTFIIDPKTNLSSNVQ